MRSTLLHGLVLSFLSFGDVLSGAPSSEARPLQPVVVAEEDVYSYESANNGAGPMWCSGSSCIVRSGGRLFATGLETLKGVPPLTNCRWVLFERKDDGWKRVFEDQGRTREPSPISAFDDGRVFVSANPTLGEKPEPNGGPARPEVVQWSGKPEVLLPKWDGAPKFSEHSYRTFISDAGHKQLLLFNNIGYTHAEWSFYENGNWAAQGKLKWPWGADYEKPEPNRVCYPDVMLRDRAVFFCGVSDVLEPNSQWRAYKKQITGRDWDYDFRRLFYTWTPDITKTPFSEWIEISSREKTGGWISPGDLWAEKDGTVHIVWAERAIDERLKQKFFPDERQRHSLEYARVKNGKIVLRKTILEAKDGAGEIASAARLQVTPEKRLFVLFYVQGKSENRVAEISPDGSIGAAVRVPFQKPFTSYFMATVRTGSAPSRDVELLGTRAGSQATISYGRLRLY